nr:urease accessory UreF family protein [Micromonospora sp. DSM 115978]
MSPGSATTLLLLADGRLPSGGHAHSGGLEAAIGADRVRDLPTLATFLRGRLTTAGRQTAAFAAATCAAASTSTMNPSSTIRTANPSSTITHPHTSPRANTPAPTRGPWRELAPPGAESHHGPLDITANAGRGGAVDAGLGSGVDVGLGSGVDVGRVWELDAGVEARTASPALRRASRAQGRALLRAGRAMWSVEAARRDLHYPVALGVVAAAAGLRPVDAAVAGAYGTVTGPASAAVRLLALDPYAVHALLAELAGECDRIAVEAAERVDEPVDELPADSAPLLEIGAEDHATWEVRLFAS